MPAVDAVGEVVSDGPGKRIDDHAHQHPEEFVEGPCRKFRVIRLKLREAIFADIEPSPEHEPHRVEPNHPGLKRGAIEFGISSGGRNSLKGLASGAEEIAMDEIAVGLVD